jgi:hypothetical protein
VVQSPSAGAVPSLGRRGFAGWRNECDYCTGIPPLAEDPPSHLASHLQTTVSIVPTLDSPALSDRPLAGGMWLS